MGFFSFISSILSEPSARCYEIFRRNSPTNVSASIITSISVLFGLLTLDAMLTINTLGDNLTSPFATLLCLWFAIYIVLQAILFLVFQLTLPTYLILAIFAYMSLTFAFVFGLYGSANLIKEGQLAILNLDSLIPANLFILILPAVIFIAKFYGLLVLHASVQGATQINTFNALAFTAISFLAMTLTDQLALIASDMIHPDTYEVLHDLVSKPSEVLWLLTNKVRGFLY